MDRLRISDNGRYFVKADGTPFIWLADTAWTVPARLKWDDVQHYMKTRRDQGFTVLQMVVLDPEYNEDMRNPCGIPALNNGNILDPNEAYFSYVDWVLDQAEAYGFYVLLLPVWGELVVGWDWSGGTHPVYVNDENAYPYGKWLGNRMKDRNNILWCLGGDRMPVCRGVDYRPVWRKMAEGLSEGLTGRRLSYDADREEWRRLLITYHACHEAETGECSTFSYWTPEDAWIGFTMLQSGHGLYKKNYELIEAERVPKHVTSEGGIPSDDAEGTAMAGAAASSDGTATAGGTASAGSTTAAGGTAAAESTTAGQDLIYPVWDGEPAYEMMPTCWPVKDLNSFHGTYMVRKRAYWGLLAGAFGHTYGHASVWNTATEKEKNVICRFSWTEAIQSDGSKQMKILRDFLEAYPLAYFEPCQERLLRQASSEDELDLHEQAARRADRAQMLVYFAADTQERIQAGDIFEGAVYGAWFDPKDGSLTVPEDLSSCMKDGILSVKNDSSDGEDRVLILSADPSGIAVPSLVYGDREEDGELRNVFEWVG